MVAVLRRTKRARVISHELFKHHVAYFTGGLPGEMGPSSRLARRAAIPAPSLHIHFSRSDNSRLWTRFTNRIDRTTMATAALLDNQRPALLATAVDPDSARAALDERPPNSATAPKADATSA